MVSKNTVIALKSDCKKEKVLVFLSQAQACNSNLTTENVVAAET